MRLGMRRVAVVATSKRGVGAAAAAVGPVLRSPTANPSAAARRAVVSRSDADEMRVAAQIASRRIRRAPVARRDSSAIPTSVIVSAGAKAPTDESFRARWPRSSPAATPADRAFRRSSCTSACCAPRSGRTPTPCCRCRPHVAPLAAVVVVVLAGDPGAQVADRRRSPSARRSTTPAGGGTSGLV